MWKCICDLFLPALEAYSAIHFTGVIDPLFPCNWCYQSTIPIFLVVLSIHLSHLTSVIDPLFPSYRCVCVWRLWLNYLPVAYSLHHLKKIFFKK